MPAGREEEPCPPAIDDEGGIEVGFPREVLQDVGRGPGLPSVRGVRAQDGLVDRGLEWPREPRGQETAVGERNYARRMVESIEVLEVVGVRGRMAIDRRTLDDHTFAGRGRIPGKSDSRNEKSE